MILVSNGSGRNFQPHRWPRSRKQPRDEGEVCSVCNSYTPPTRDVANKPQHPEGEEYNYFIACCLVTGTSCYGNCDVFASN